MENARTVTEIKLSFIRDQIRILSAALEPAPNWRDYGPDVEEEISDKTVEDVLQKCTDMLQPFTYARVSGYRAST